MPLAIINVGIDADDVTGDTNRDGWIKVNVNFATIESILEEKATSTEVDALADSTVAALALINDALALKQDVGDPLDPGDGVAHFDAAQTINDTERKQLISNTGGFVTLIFPLIDADTTINTQTVKLPIPPENFIVHSVYLSLAQRSIGTGGALLVTFTLDQGATSVAYATAFAVTSAGKVIGSVTVNNWLNANGATTITVTVTNTETGTPIAKGLTLWLRGHWSA